MKIKQYRKKESERILFYILIKFSHNKSMIEYLIRFLAVYFFLLLSMKILGKRQIGEMQMSELVAAFFLSELATFAVTDKKIPIYYGLILIVVMILVEMIISFLAVKIPFVKRIFDTSPCVLIREGKILEKELLKNRMTLDELFSHLRLVGFYDLNDVRFAILEPNGQLSVVPFYQSQPPSCEDLNVKVLEKGFTVVLIDDGVLNAKALSAIGKNRNWLRKILEKNHILDIKSVFLLASDFLGNIVLLRKGEET